MADMSSRNGSKLRRVVRYMDLAVDDEPIAARDYTHGVGETPREVNEAQALRGIDNVVAFRAAYQLVMTQRLTDYFSAERARIDSGQPYLVSRQVRIAALLRSPLADASRLHKAQRVARQSNHLSIKEIV